MVPDSLPNIIILGLYLVTGCIGNILVLYIYRFKMGRTLDNRIFIPCLATADLISSLLCSVFAIYALLFPESYNKTIICKLSWYTMTWSPVVSMTILMMIAAQRYMKICHPLSNFFFTGREIMAVVSLYIFAILLVIPILFMAGVTTVKYRDNSTEDVCDRVGESFRYGGKHRFAIAYTVLEIATTPIIFVSITYFYSRVSFTLYKRMKQKAITWNKSKNIETGEKTSATAQRNDFTHGDLKFGTISEKKLKHKHKKRHYNKKESNVVPIDENSRDFDMSVITEELPASSSTITTTKDDNGHTINHKNRLKWPHSVRKAKKKNIKPRKREIQQNHSNLESSVEIKPTSYKTRDTKNNSIEPKRSGSKERSTQSFFKQHRYTLIFILISVTFVLSCTPRAVLMVIETIDWDFWISFSDRSTYQLMLFLNRLHIINSVINPILYGIFDEAFKLQLIKLFKCEKSRCRGTVSPTEK